MSNDHFKGRFEVEFKYRVVSKHAFLDVLHALEHQVMFENNTESDVYFDTPDKHLFKQGKSLCIRELAPSGIKLWIVKGPGPDRCEATNITDAVSARSMLKNLGYQAVMTMSKTRSVYFVGKYHLTLDHLQGIGDFAEFAIMTDDEEALEHYKTELQSLAARFGLTDEERECKSYRDLYKALNH